MDDRKLSQNVMLLGSCVGASHFIVSLISRRDVFNC